MELNEDILKLIAIDSIEKAIKKIELSTNQLKGISIPEDFVLAGKIKSSEKKLHTIEKECKDIKEWIKTAINKFNMAERKNLQALLDLGIITSFPNIIWTSFGKSNLDNTSIDYQIWYSLRDAGFDDIHIAAIMGNLDYESGGIDPSRIEGGYDEFIGGIGLAQWTNYPRNSGNGRNTMLRQFAAAMGTDWRDFNTQLSFLIAELTGTGPAVSYMNPNYPPFNDQINYYSGLPYSNLATKSGFSNATTLEEAMAAFLYSFENPPYEDAANSYNERLKRATDYYNEYHYAGLSDEGKNLTICKEITETLIARNAHYPTEARGWNLPTTVQSALNDDKDVCCVTYADIFLYKSGAIPAEIINNYDINNINYGGAGAGLITMLTDNGWKKIDKKDIHSGDILIKQGDGQAGHTAVYISEGIIYDQTSAVVSSSGTQPTNNCVSKEKYDEFMGDTYDAYTSPNKVTLNDPNITVDLEANSDGESKKQDVDAEEYNARVATPSGVNVREKPDINSNKRTALLDGTPINIKDEQSGWGKIDSDGEDGWVNLEYVEKKDDDDNS